MDTKCTGEASLGYSTAPKAPGINRQGKAALAARIRARLSVKALHRVTDKQSDDHVGEM